MSRAVNQQRGAGRPKGSRTTLHGLNDFMRAYGYTSKAYVHEVLRGKRSGGRPVRIAWARWQAEQAAAK